MRLPACWNGIFTLKPSLGRVPVDPPYFGRAVGPMTRTVADSALLLAELSKPDARDHMSLPPADIDWSAGPLEPKGLKIGLHLDAGSGLPVDAEVKAAVEAAARLFADAGAKVEPVAPFLSPEMLHLQDLFWRVRSWVDFSALSHARQASVLPFIADWCRGGADVSGATVIKAVNNYMAIRAAATRATQPLRLRAVAGLAGADLSRRMGDADQRRPAAARAHLLHHALQHERAAGRLDQLRLHQRGQADRPADRRPPLRRSRRDADLALVRRGEGAAEESVAGQLHGVKRSRSAS